MDELNRYRKTLAVVDDDLAVVVKTLAVVVNTLAVVVNALAVIVKTLAVIVNALAVVVNTLAVVDDTLAVVDDTLAVTDKKNVVIFGLFKAIPENLKMELECVVDCFLTLGNLLLFSCETFKLLKLKQYEVKGNTITFFNR